MEDTKQKSRRSTPPGFGRVWLDGKELLLPNEVANQFADNLEIRRIEKAQKDAETRTAIEAALEARTKELEEKEAAKKAAKPEQARINKHPKNSRFEHASIVNFTELDLRLIDAGDKKIDDLNDAERMRVIRRVVELGDTRYAIVDPGWRSALNRLRDQFPSFRSVIDTIHNAYAVSEKTLLPPQIRPMLMVGDPGLGKSHFAKKLANALSLEMGWLSVDGANSASTLRGTDKHWSNSTPGLLVSLIGDKGCANPLIVLDEIDKPAKADITNQFLACLEPSTAVDFEDLCTGVRMDTTLVTYLATANSLAAIPAPLLSRLDVYHIEMPPQELRRDAAWSIVQTTLEAMGLDCELDVSRGCTVVLENRSPRVIARATEKAASAAVAAGQNRLMAEHFEVALGIHQPKQARSTLH